MKSQSRLFLAGALGLMVPAMTACQGRAQQGQTGDGPGICRPQAAESLVGRKRVSDAEAMQITGATVVRQIAPGQGVTMDYRRERVTIETDPATNEILRAMCG